MTSDIEKVEISLEHAKEGVALADKTLRLAENSDFQKIVLKGYLQDEAARLTSLLGDPQISEQNEVLNDLRAIASFQRYMRRIINTGEILRKEIEDHMITLGELRQEA